jgi:hypothetical protein
MLRHSSCRCAHHGRWTRLDIRAAERLDIMAQRGGVGDMYPMKYVSRPVGYPPPSVAI